MRHLENRVAQRITPDAATAAADTAVTITVAADAEHFWVLEHLIWSYSADPTAGQITAKWGDSEVTLLDVDVTVGGPGFLNVGSMHNTDANGKVTKNEKLVVTLAAGGTGVIGNLSIIYK